jgi:hypothetical protein
MEESRDPYAAPKADISIAPEKAGADVKKVFSPAQGSVASFLGGPLVGTYIVAMNYWALGAMKRARLTAIWGIVITAATLFCGSLLPNRVVGFSVNAAYGVATWLIIGRTQFAKPQIVASSTLTSHSNWRVAGVVFLGLFITFVLSRMLAHLLSGG